MSSVLRRATEAEELELGGWTPPPVGPELEEPEVDGPSASGGVSVVVSVSAVVPGPGESALEGGDGMILLAGSILTVASEGFPVVEFW
jgi:hypothetical protein